MSCSIRADGAVYRTNLTDHKTDANTWPAAFVRKLGKNRCGSVVWVFDPKDYNNYEEKCNVEYKQDVLDNRHPFRSPDIGNKQNQNHRKDEKCLLPILRLVIGVIDWDKSFCQISQYCGKLDILRNGFGVEGCFKSHPPNGWCPFVLVSQLSIQLPALKPLYKNLQFSMEVRTYESWMR